MVMKHDDDDARVLKSGSNQFKLIEFHVGDMIHGINLLKVKKIIEFKPEEIRPVFDVPNGVLGVQEVNDQIISIIDLRTIYGIPKETKNTNMKDRAIIITEFNQTQYGFVIDQIQMVHRLSWKALQPVTESCPSDMIVAVATTGERDILMIDFEMIIDKLYPKSLKLPPQINTDILDVMERRNNAVIICADDSKIIRKKLQFIFTKHSFGTVTVCTNGQEAYDELMNRNAEASENEASYTFMLTDIEMPQMDGLTLCKKVKEKFPEIPVLILSSLVSEQLILKCREVNANAALSKNNLDALVSHIDSLLLEQEENRGKPISQHVTKDQDPLLKVA